MSVLTLSGVGGGVLGSGGIAMEAVDNVKVGVDIFG